MGLPNYAHHIIPRSFCWVMSVIGHSIILRILGWRIAGINARFFAGKVLVSKYSTVPCRTSSQEKRYKVQFERQMKLVYGKDMVFLPTVVPAMSYSVCYGQ